MTQNMFTEKSQQSKDEQEKSVPSKQDYEEMLDLQKEQNEILQEQAEQMRQMQMKIDDMSKKKQKNMVSLVSLLFFIVGLFLPYASIDKSVVSVDYYDGSAVQFVDMDMNAFSGTLISWWDKLLTVNSSIHDVPEYDRNITILRSWNDWNTAIEKNKSSNTVGMVTGVVVCFVILFIILFVDMFKKIAILKFLFGIITTLAYVTPILYSRSLFREFNVSMTLQIGFYSLAAGSVFLVLSLFTYGKKKSREEK